MVRDALRRGQQRLARQLMKIGPFRRWYAARLVKYIDRSKEKRRPLGELGRIERQIRSLPKAERVKTVAKLLEPMNEEQFGRQLRRAAARQDRGSGRGSSRRRPGSPPQKIVQRRG